jgi:hypothetical protein
LPETIADRGSGWPLDIVHGNDHLYFTETDVVFRLVPDGSAAPTAFYNSVWTDPGDNNIVDIASDEGDPDISDLDNELLWVHEGSWLLSGQISATTVQGNRIFATSGPGPAGGVEIDKDWYFYGRLGTGHEDGYVRARVRSDPQTNVAVTTTGHPVALAFDGMHLYWAKAKADDMSTDAGDDYLPDSGAIQRSEFEPMSQTFGTPETLIDGLPELVDLIVDDEWVYWISSFTSDGGASMHRLSRMPKNGGAEAILNEGDYGPAHITQDETSVYWTVMSHPSGSVKRWAK